MPKRIRRFITPEYILVSILLLVAFVVRIFRVNQILGFYYDQGRDALVIWDLIHSHKFFLIGPTTGIAGIFRGPFYYYLIAPFYWLGRGNPVWPDIFLALTSIIALGLMYYLAKKIGGFTAGIIALILGGFSFEIIYASRWLSNPTPMLLLSMLLVWMLFLIYEGKKWAWIILSFILGLSLFHFGSSGEVFYFPAVAVFAVWMLVIKGFGKKGTLDWKTIFLSIIVFLLTLSPLVLFDLKHGGILGGNIKGFLVTGKSFTLPGWKFAIDRLSLLWGYFSTLIFHSIYDKEILILEGLGVYIIYFLGKIIKDDKFKILSLLLISPILGLVFFQGNYGNLYMYYLTGYYLIFLLTLSASLGYIFKNSIIGKVVVIGFLAIFISQNYPLVKGYVMTKGDDKSQIILENQKAAIDWIYMDAGENTFNVDEYVPPVIPYSYNYLFKWLGTNQYHKFPVEQQVSLLYTLYEVDPPHPERLDAWLARQRGIGRVEKTAQFGGITVERRMRIK